jgi:hypothetical protein
VGAQVVGVLLARLERIAGSRRVLLVAADEQPPVLVPVVKGSEERILGELRPGPLVVGADLRRLRTGVLPQVQEERLEPVAAALVELLQEVLTPGRQRRQLVLEGPDDDVAEQLPTRRSNSPWTASTSASQAAGDR